VRIVVEDLTVRYGRTPVLDRLDFVAEPGSVTALVGPNGCGKTTLLKAIAGTVAHSGSIRIGEMARAGRSSIGFMPQDGGSRAALTVFEVVLLGRLSRLGMKVGEADLAAAAGALDDVGMARHAERWISDLSGGERQLVHFAQVLAREPKVLLLDEPTSALDLRNQLVLLSTIGEQSRTRGLTTIVTLHDLNAATRFADRIAVLHGGRLHRHGPSATTIDATVLADVWRIEAEIVAPADGVPSIVPVRVTDEHRRRDAKPSRRDAP